MDIEKAFDSLDHTFVIPVSNKFGFGNNFVSGIKTLTLKRLGDQFDPLALWFLEKCIF